MHHQSPMEYMQTAIARRDARSIACRNVFSGRESIKLHAYGECRGYRDVYYEPAVDRPRHHRRWSTMLQPTDGQYRWIRYDQCSQGDVAIPSHHPSTKKQFPCESIVCLQLNGRNGETFHFTSQTMTCTATHPDLTRGSMMWEWIHPLDPNAMT
jgi:hypothetical protein